MEWCAALVWTFVEPHRGQHTPCGQRRWTNHCSAALSSGTRSSTTATTPSPAPAWSGPASRAGVERFLFALSAAVYGLPGAAPVGEDAPAAPVHAYGRSKLATERLLRETAARHGMRYAGAAVFQRGGRRPARPGRPGRPGSPPRHDRLPGRARPARRGHRVRRRLPDTRRDLYARLHPRLRSCRHPCVSGAPQPRERRAGPSAQLRFRARGLGPRGARGRARGSRGGFRDPQRPAPRRRRPGRGRRYRAPARRPAVVAASWRASRDRAKRARLGKGPRRRARDR